MFEWAHTKQKIKVIHKKSGRLWVVSRLMGLRPSISAHLRIVGGEYVKQQVSKNKGTMLPSYFRPSGQPRPGGAR